MQLEDVEEALNVVIDLCRLNQQRDTTRRGHFYREY